MTSTRRTLLRVLLVVLLGLGLTGGVAWAFWTTTTTAGSNGASLTASLNQVPTPTASATGRAVRVTWAESTVSNGAAVDGYLVKRYDAATLTPQVVGSGCAGALFLATCVESSVPAGTWVYSVTPLLATNWRGVESVKSSPITVAAPTLALSSTRARPGTTLAGTASGFIVGETLRYRFDGPAGAELTGTLAGSATPAVVPATGGGAVTVVIPAGASDGTHTVYAVASPTGESASVTVVVDGTAPPAPVFTQTPANPSGDTGTFAFTEAEAGATVECRLDTAAYAPCESPMSFTELIAGSHTFQARATDTVGNVSVATSYIWTVNLTIPTVSIGFPAMGASYNDAGFTAGCGTSSVGDLCGSAEDDVAVLAIAVSLRQASTGLYWNGSSFSGSSENFVPASLLVTDWSYGIGSGSLSEGVYTVRARASDGINVGYDSRTFTIDRTVPAAPTLTIPPPATSGPWVMLGFTTSDPTASFECRMDSGPWVLCASPKQYDALTDGSHTISVRAFDPAGNTSAVTSRTWVVDAVAPSAVLSFPSPGTYNRAGWAAGCATPTTGDLCGTASDARSGLASVTVSIRRVDTNGYWNGTGFTAASETWHTATGTAAWNYPFEATSFPADGAYTVRWRATDAVGNSTTGGVDLTVDTVAPAAPVIVQAPQDPSGSSVQFDFTTAGTGTVSECRLDAGSWTVCSGPVGYGPLAPGAHSFAIRSTDAAGNVSGAATYSWNVDTGIPNVNISSPAGGRAYNDASYNAGCATPTGDICGTASDPQGNLSAVHVSIQQASTQLYWNGSSFSSAAEVFLPVTGSATWTLPMPSASFPADGGYTVRARATDGAGLTALDSVSITLDRVAPAAPTLTSGPTGTTAGSGTFTFTGEASALFECQLDGGAWATCASPRTYGSLADGSRTFAVRALDVAGNTGPAASRTWTVDTTAPSIATTFPAVGGRYNAATYDAGCVAATGDICGTTVDSPAGVAQVEVSVQRAGTGLFLSGTTFSSGTPVWVTANGTTTWSLPLAAATFPADDTYTLTVRATDTVGNARTASTAYVIDRTTPVAAGLSSANATGGTQRKLDLNDTLALTYSEAVSPSSIIAGWNGTTTQNVVVRATGSGGSKDRLTIYNAGNTALLPLGTINLNRTDYVTGAVTFGATGTPSTLTMNGSTLTITLGTPSNATRVTIALAAANMSWIPSATVRDLAGNAASTTTSAETDNDSDF